MRCTGCTVVDLGSLLPLSSGRSRLVARKLVGMCLVGGSIPLCSCRLAGWVVSDCTLLHTCVVATLRCETIVYGLVVGIVGAGSAAYACQFAHMCVLSLPWVLE